MLRHCTVCGCVQRRVTCNVCGSDDLCCVLHCVLLRATKGRDKKSIDGMAENQRVLALNRHGFSEGYFRVNSVSGNVNPCAQVPAVSRKCAHGFP